MKWAPCDCGKHYGNPMVGAFWTMCAFLFVGLVAKCTIFLYAAVTIANEVSSKVYALCS